MLSLRSVIVTELDSLSLDQDTPGHVRWYNTERRHSGIKGLTPVERIGSYYASQMRIQRLTN